MSTARTVSTAVALLVTVVAASTSALFRTVNGLSVPVTADDVTWIIGYAVFGGVGAVIAFKRPGHPIGWMFLAIGALGGVTEAAFAIAQTREGSPDTLGAVAGWVNTWLWAPGIGLVVWSIVLFPTGRPLTRWLGILGRTVFVVTLGVAGLNAVDLWRFRSPGLALTETPPETVATTVIGIVFPLVLLSAVIAMGSLVVRYRRSVGAERAQMKWIAAAAAVAAPAIVLGETLLTDGIGGVLMDLLSVPLWFAVAAGVAILRYRLYEIDRIISRTISYALVTAILIGVYAASVLGFGAAARSVAGDPGDLVVALSTLVAAALFTPVRRRVQGFVDRRFNRARFDALRSAGEFGRRLREHVELGAVTDELTGVVTRTLQPSWMGLVTTRTGSS